MNAKQMKAKADRLTRIGKGTRNWRAWSDKEAEQAFAILRAVAGGEVCRVKGGTIQWDPLEPHGPWADALVIQGGGE